LTGGEPLLTDRLWPLLDALSLGRQTAAHPFSRLKDVAITTNGSLLNDNKARRLRAAGVDRITISLDAVDGASIARMAGLRSGPEAGNALFARVLAGIDAARAAGFDPAQGGLKLNAVIQRGFNDDQLIPLARLARQQRLQLRLIEYMDVGNRNGWCRDQVMPAQEMIQLFIAIGRFNLLVDPLLGRVGSGRIKMVVGLWARLPPLASPSVPIATA
jgi:cyclic pyranopterin phosphate synthase